MKDLNENQKIKFSFITFENKDDYKRAKSLLNQYIKEKFLARFRTDSMFEKKDISFLPDQLTIVFHVPLKKIRENYTVRYEIVKNLQFTQEYLNNPDVALKEEERKRIVRKRLEGFKNHAFDQSPDNTSKETVPDDLKVYINPKRPCYKNSLEWAQYSHQVVSDVSLSIKNVKGDISFLSLLRDLGKKRLEIAIKLGHGVKEGRTYEYGALRGIDVLGTGQVGEIFSCDHQAKIVQWGDFLPYELTKEKFDTHVNNPDLFIPGSENSPSKYFFKTHKVNDLEYGRFRIEATKGDLISFFIIYYPEINEEEVNQWHDYLASYFNNALAYKNPKNDSEVKELLFRLGKFAFHMFRTLPYKLGTSGIVEWMVRGISLSKDITLGKKVDSNTENWNFLSMDWEAFSPIMDEESYAEWFLKYAFESYTYVNNQDLAVKNSNNSHCFQFNSNQPDEAQRKITKDIRNENESGSITNNRTSKPLF